MPKIISRRTLEQIEQDFADALSEFLPEQLTLSNDAARYPYIREKGILGYIKGQVADFTSCREVKIYKKKWHDPIIKAIKQYEEMYGTQIEVTTYY